VHDFIANLLSAVPTKFRGVGAPKGVARTDHGYVLATFLYSIAHNKDTWTRRDPCDCHGMSDADACPSTRISSALLPSLALSRFVVHVSIPPAASASSPSDGVDQDQLRGTDGRISGCVFVAGATGLSRNR